ncbi:MAG: winged helix-turn-helix domain-containing protein [Bacteroidota bacterium]
MESTTLDAIRYGMVHPSNARQIAKAVGLSTSSVQHLISHYNKEEASAIETKGSGGRKYGYLTLEQEKSFLASCQEKALSGHYTTVRDIQKAFEQKIGKSVARSTIYRLSDRHSWRKLVPRPKHPDQDMDKQEEFKKTLQNK